MQTQEKKYNSLTSIAFTIHHDKADGSDLTERDYINALLYRIADVANNDGFFEACGGELADTVVTEDGGRV